jgi:hypothetical protein
MRLARLKRSVFLAIPFLAATAMLSSPGSAQNATTAGPYKVLQTAKVGGEGG